MLFSEKPFFFHTYKTVITDNDMIEKADAKQFPGFINSSCYHYIFSARSGISAGMIMKQYDSVGVSFECFDKQFPRRYKCTVYRSFRNITLPILIAACI